MPLGQHFSHIIKQKAGPDDPELAETLQDALSQVDPGVLVAVADELAARRERWVLAISNLGALPPDDRLPLFRALTTSWKSARTLSEYLGRRALEPALHTLLDENAPPGARIAAVAGHWKDLDPRLSLEFATGLLHMQSPARYWLWTRWMWDPIRKTGILPLMTGGLHHLQAADLATGYVRVDSATALSMRFAEGTGLLSPELMDDPRRRVYASDVFLVCAYSIYMYGVTSWRLSREFNRLMPPLPDMMRKLLGLPKRK